MALEVRRVEIWVAAIEDRPGALAGKLTDLAEAGAQLEFVLARRAPDKPGSAVVFLTPVKGARQLKAARKMGFHKSKSINAVRVEGRDKPGLGAKLTSALADAGINLRGLSASVVGKRFVLHVALDSPADATKAARIVKKLS